MTHDRRFRLYAMFLAIVAAATIWIVGSGEATPHREALWAQRERPPVDTDRGPAGQSGGRETLYKYSKLLTDISYRIQSAYMDTINTKEMIYSGIRGMLDVLDPFSVLMEQQNYDRLMESTHGKYEGLGMQIDLRQAELAVPNVPNPIGRHLDVVHHRDESAERNTSIDLRRLMPAVGRSFDMKAHRHAQCWF